jgi:cytochrome c553
MSRILFIFIIIFSLTKSYAEDKKSKTEVGATVTSNLSASLQLGKEKAKTLCATCHGLDGVAASGGNSVIIPNLTAQHKDYLKAKLIDYKTGKLQHEQMSVVASMLTDEEIEGVSEWYSRIKVKIFDPNLVLAKPSE